MAICKEDVLYVAELARIDFSDEELNAFQKDLDNILVYFKKLDELDTTDVEPAAHVTDIKNRFRDDEVKPSIDRDKALSNASSVKENCFMVPKIIE